MSGREERQNEEINPTEAVLPRKEEVESHLYRCVEGPRVAWKF